MFLALVRAVLMMVMSLVMFVFLLGLGGIAGDESIYADECGE